MSSIIVYLDDTCMIMLPPSPLSSNLTTSFSCLPPSLSPPMHPPSSLSLPCLLPVLLFLPPPLSSASSILSLHSPLFSSSLSSTFPLPPSLPPSPTPPSLPPSLSHSSLPTVAVYSDSICGILAVQQYGRRRRRGWWWGRRSIVTI